MGQPVVHFEIMGKDGEALKPFYAEMFGWEYGETPSATEAPYATVDQEQNQNKDGVGIGGGIGTHPMGEAHVTFYVEVPDVEAGLSKAEELGGSRIMGPVEPMEGLEIGLFTDPQGSMIGLVREEG